MSFATVVVIAKEPLPGRAKTRLVPPLTYEQAAEVAGAALWDTLRAVGAVPARERLLAFDGNPARWQPEGWRVTQQPGGGLDVRLTAAFAAAGAAADGPAVLVGMDTPQLRAAQLTVFDPTRYDACLGLASDGGFWALGFADPHLAADTILDVPMSQDDTGRIQLDRLRRKGLRVQLLDELTDADTIDSAHEAARQAPGSAFARTLARVARPG